MNKKLAILLLIFVNIFTSFTQNDPQYSFEQFQIQFEKNYESEEDREYHRQWFYKNFKLFLLQKKTNPHIQVNKFMDWDLSQQISFFNYRPMTQSKNPTILQSSEKRLSLGAPPAEFDYRSLNKVTPIKDQGTCGACWAFTSTAAFESLLLINQNQQYDLSEQYVLECEQTSQGCAGGYEYNALKLLNFTGAPLETQFPYKSKSPYFSTSDLAPICTNFSSYVRLQKNVSSVRLYTNVTNDFLKSVIATYGPAIAGIKGDDPSFQFAGSSGIVDNCQAVKNFTQLNHAVVVVGYTSTHWIVKNSWGTNWGSQGFAYVNMNSNCGLSLQVTVLQISTVAQPVSQIQTLTIYKQLASGVSWGNWILGVQQNGVIIYNFAYIPYQSADSNVVTVEINSTALVKFVVFKAGTRATSKNILFSVKTNDEQLVYFKGYNAHTYNLTYVYASTQFTTYCGSVCLPREGYEFYYLWLTDTYGDGWNDNVMEIRQPSKNMSYGEQFVVGHSSGPYIVELKKNETVKIVSKYLGGDRREVGYRMTDRNGRIIAQWAPGKLYPADVYFWDFCYICIPKGNGSNYTNYTVGSSQYSSLSQMEIGLIAGLAALALLALLMLSYLIWLCLKNKNAGVAEYSPKQNMFTQTPYVIPTANQQQNSQKGLIVFSNPRLIQKSSDHLKESSAQTHESEMPHQRDSYWMPSRSIKSIGFVDTLTSIEHHQVI